MGTLEIDRHKEILGKNDFVFTWINGFSVVDFSRVTIALDTALMTPSNDGHDIDKAVARNDHLGDCSTWTIQCGDTAIW